MRKTIFAVLASLPMIAVASTPQRMPIIEIHDGDTITTNVLLPEPLNVVAVRIKGIDTPEMPAPSYATTGRLGRAKCKKEADLAIVARNSLVQLAASANYQLVIVNYEWDKYGSRILADVYFGKINAAEFLKSKGLAREYWGEGPKPDWCA